MIIHHLSIFIPWVNVSHNNIHTHYMEKSTLERLIMDSYFPPDSSQASIGKKLLDLMFFDLATKNKQAQIYKEIQPNFSQFIQNKLSFPTTPQHIQQCFGNLYQKKNFKLIEKVQKDIDIFLSSKSKGKSTLSFQSSLNIDKPSNSTVTIPNSNYKVSRWAQYQEQYHEEEDDDDEDGFKNSLETVDFSSLFDKLEFSGIEDHDKIQVKNYLQKQIISQNSQLSFVRQCFKFQLGNWKRQKIGDFFTESNVLTGNNYFTFNKEKNFEGIGKDKNSKNAKEKASFMILTRVYSQLPLVFKQVQKIKKEKNLKY